MLITSTIYTQQLPIPVCNLWSCQMNIFILLGGLHFGWNIFSGVWGSYEMDQTWLWFKGQGLARTDGQSKAAIVDSTIFEWQSGNWGYYQKLSTV